MVSIRPLVNQCLFPGSQVSQFAEKAASFQPRPQMPPTSSQEPSVKDIRTIANLTALSSKMTTLTVAAKNKAQELKETLEKIKASSAELFSTISSGKIDETSMDGFATVKGSVQTKSQESQTQATQVIESVNTVLKQVEGLQQKASSVTGGLKGAAYRDLPPDAKHIVAEKTANSKIS